MAETRYKIVGLYEGKEITLKTVYDEVEAETERVRFATCFTSTWKITIKKVTGDL